VDSSDETLPPSSRQKNKPRKIACKQVASRGISRNMRLYRRQEGNERGHLSSHWLARFSFNGLHIVIKSRGKRSRYRDWLRAGRPRGRSSGGGKNFYFSMSSRPALGVQPTSYPMGTGALSPGVKRQGREADHSPPTSAEMKKMWIYTSTPTYVFMA
jgi:hypothetical protein